MNEKHISEPASQPAEVGPADPTPTPDAVPHDSASAVVEAVEIEDAPIRQPAFPIVGIGASAGGLPAFEGFFTSMPSDSGMAFVLVQHLAPHHESILAEIVSRYTTMPVFQVTDGILVEPNTVYVIPPNRDMALLHQSLHLIEPAMPRGLRLPIDFFFRSLADELHEYAIGIILSGTGTDGTLGLRAIKGTGGMVMVQEPVSARYDGMPRSAIDTDLVDYILPPEQMPDYLLQYTRHEFVSGVRRTAPLLSQSTDALQKICILLRNQTGHDFSLYKKSTMLRRIERRMAINQITWINDYIRYLQRNAQETDSLFREMFIGVTGFFRDPEAFAALEERIIPKLLDRHTPGQQVRVWVPACSTGEEAFSIAILLCEQMDARRESYDVQIFATDIDSHAIEKARSAIYPNSIAAEVPPERLARFFQQADNTYQVARRVRDMVVFAVQNLIKDPPFSSLDLISCRNLLIYLELELQKKVLSLFHRALNPEGFLLLGTSETTGAADHLFKTIDRRWQIFQRPPGNSLVAPAYDFPLPAVPGARRNEADEMREPDINLRAVTEQLLLEHTALAAIVVEEKGTMLYIHGKTGRYWETTTGKVDWNIFRLARDGLRLVLTMALRKALSQRKEVIREEARFGRTGGEEKVYISIKFVPGTRLLLIIFEEHVPTDPLQITDLTLDPTNERDAYILKLRRELDSAQDYLAATNEELQASNEELRSSNEELQSSNEELRAANEELGTSKEELQSVNEELVTVNAELQSKIGELSRANNYLHNLLINIDIGMIFLDQRLRIVWFTPMATRVVHLIDTDIGRPLSDLVPNIDYEHVIADARHVLDTLEARAAEVRTRDTNEWYWMRITPYRTTDDIIEGVVITLSSITRQKQAQAELRKLIRALEHSFSMIIITDTQGVIEYVNPRFIATTGYPAQEVIGQNVRMLKADASALALHEEAWQIISSGREWHGEFLNRKKNGERYWVAASRAPVRDETGRITHFIAVEEDITERKQREAALQANEQFLSSIYTGTSVPIFVIEVTEQERFFYAGINPACERITGYTREQVQGRYLEELDNVLSPLAIERLHKNFQHVVQSGAALEYEQMAPTPAQQQETWWLTRLEPLRNTQGRVYRIVATSRPITTLKRAAAAVHRREALLAALGDWWAAVFEAGSSPERLLRTMCATLIEAGGYRAAWAGEALAHAGPRQADVPEAFVASACMASPGGHISVASRWLEHEAGPALARRALHAGRPVWIFDSAATLALRPTADWESWEPWEPWRPAALREGCTAAVALPFDPAQLQLGAVVLFANRPDALEADDLGILQVMTDNLARGLQAVRSLHQHDAQD